MGGAVNNAVRQLGGVIGTALAVVLIGQPDTPLQGFQTAFLWIAGLSAVTAVIAMGIPSVRHSPQAIIVEIEDELIHEKIG